MYVWSIFFLVSTGFILGTPVKLYHFLATSVKEKGAWFSDLHKHIFSQKKLFHKVEINNITQTNFTCVHILPIQLLSHLSIPDENFYYMQARSKVNYIGMLNDGQCQILSIYLCDCVELWTLVELSFRAGDGVSVMGFMAGEERWHPGLYTTHEAFNPSPEWYVGEAGIMIYSNYRVAL